MSGRSCSLANTVFFETDPSAPQEPPQCVARYRHSTLAQFGQKGVQRQVRLLRQPSQQPLPLAVQLAAAATTPRARCWASRRSRPLCPFHNTGNAHPEQRRYLAARLAVANRRHDPLPKIHRIGSCHRCWPPPSQQFESHQADLGNPFRFSSLRKDSSATGPCPECRRRYDRPWWW